MKKYNSPIIEIEIIECDDVLLNSPFAEVKPNEVTVDWNFGSGVGFDF